MSTDVSADVLGVYKTFSCVKLSAAIPSFENILQSSSGICEIDACEEYVFVNFCSHSLYISQLKVNARIFDLNAKTLTHSTRIGADITLSSFCFLSWIQKYTMVSDICREHSDLFQQKKVFFFFEVPSSKDMHDVTTFLKRTDPLELPEFATTVMIMDTKPRWVEQNHSCKRLKVGDMGFSFDSYFSIVSEPMQFNEFGEWFAVMFGSVKSVTQSSIRQSIKLPNGFNVPKEFENMIQHSDNISQLTYGKKTITFNLAYDSNATNWTVTMVGISDLTFAQTTPLLSEGETIVRLLVDSVQKKPATGLEMMQITRKIMNEIYDYRELKHIWDLCIQRIILEWETHVTDYRGANQSYIGLRDSTPVHAHSLPVPGMLPPILPCRTHSQL